MSEATSIAFSGPRALARQLEAAGYRVLELGPEGQLTGAPTTTPRASLLAEAEGGPDGHASLLDPLLAVRARWPLVDALVHAPGASAALVRELLRAGARDVVLEREIERVLIVLGEVLESQRLLPLVDQLAERGVQASRFEGMLSRSPALWDAFEICARVAPTDAHVLVVGETGTGKELMARAVHERSQRTGPFVALNCASLPESLVESELFGHEKGAFTGAARANPGLFRHADRGTVFLDEVGDLSPAAQQSLLRVLETRAVRPVGGAEETPVNVRVVAATHVPLEDAVASGDFREDLFFRLDVIRLEIPPLRERPEDIVYLFGHFLGTLAGRYGIERPEVGDDFLRRLVAYPWPGNVRELENFTERVLLRGSGAGRLGVRDFVRLSRTPDAGRRDDEGDGTARSPADAFSIDTSQGLDETLGPVVDEVERRYLHALLERTAGRIQEAARLAGISRRTLQRKLARHGIDKASYR